MKGNCGECCRRWYCETNPDDCDEWPDPVPITNENRIRAMSDEELAKILGDKCICPPTSECSKVCGDCDVCWLEWLQQRAEALYG